MKGKPCKAARVLILPNDNFDSIGLDNMFYQLVVFLSLPIPCLLSADYLDDKSFHYVIVGGGTSGAVVASRLSEDPAIQVLLVEAGDKPLPESDIPLLSHRAFGSDMDWNLETAPQKTCCTAFLNNKMPLHCGKALGGTSSLNFMMYAKGSKFDFDNWEQPDWSYENVSSYFSKLEDYQVPHSQQDASYHSQGGPLTVSEPYVKSPAADLFLEAGYEIGHRLTDYTGRSQIGFSYPSMTIRDGSRLSTNGAYLKHNLRRPNLHVSLNSFATKILIGENKTVYGLVYEKHQRPVTVTVKNELIVCAGAINSPKLLMLSGIGPREMLENFRIPVVVDLPGVGQNLQDHVSVLAQTYRLNQSVTLKPSTYETEQNLGLWHVSRTGPMTSPMGFEGVAYLSSDLNFHREWPDIQIKMNSANIWRIYRNRLRAFWKYASPNEFQDTVTFFPTLLKPKSRGQISLSSSNPFDPPVVDPKYLSHPDDVLVLQKAIEISQRIATSRTFRRYGSMLFNLGLFPRCIYKIFIASEYYKCIATTMTIGGYSFAGTCKMGSSEDETAVVDNELRVFGVNGLRVADASIMPTLVTSETAATCVMIGEKASDMIKLDWQLQRQKLNESIYCE